MSGWIIAGGNKRYFPCLDYISENQKGLDFRNERMKIEPLDFDTQKSR
jgi:hypothetical protein